MKRFSEFELEEKTNWLSTDVTYFKETGKYYGELKDIPVPNNCSFYERREYLTEYIKRIPNHEVFTYVSLDSHVLGFPYMKKAIKAW